MLVMRTSHEKPVVESPDRVEHDPIEGVDATDVREIGRVTPRVDAGDAERVAGP